MGGEREGEKVRSSVKGGGGAESEEGREGVKIVITKGEKG